MSVTRPKQSLLLSAYAFLELVYHTVVREVRSESGNAALGIISAIARIVLLVALFYAVFAIIGRHGGGIRGDSGLFLISGVLLFFLHNQSIQKTLRGASFAGPMIQHAPMTSTLTIFASVLAIFYLYLLSLFVIFLGLYFMQGHLEIYRPVGLIAPFVLAWASGIVIGLIFLLVKPFAPRLVQLISMTYMRANLVTSGKFFVANMLPAFVLPYFTWNPLFHAIDQMRGALFVNYFPHVTNLTYPTYFVMVGLVIGLMGEFWLRRNVSKSTGKRA